MTGNAVTGQRRTKGGNRFCLIIPVYNHDLFVGNVVKEALKLNFPVIVVDDGSTDTTKDLLEEIQGIRVLHHEKNLGKGAALLTGFREAAKRYDFAIVLDADGQHFPKDAHCLIKAIPHGMRPLVLGYRKEMTGPDIPWTSSMGRRFSNLWVRASGGPMVLDSQSGFRLYPLAEILSLKTCARRYQFEVEVLVKAHQKGIPVIEAPIHVWYPSREDRISHFRPFIDFLRNSATFSRLIFRRIVGLP